MGLSQLSRVSIMLPAVFAVLVAGVACAATMPPAAGGVGMLSGRNEAQCSGGFDLYFVLDRYGISVFLQSIRPYADVKGMGLFT